MKDTADLRAWFREDIARTLISIRAAQWAISAQHTSNDNERAFNSGFVAALGCVALAVGLKSDDIALDMANKDEHSTRAPQF